MEKSLTIGQVSEQLGVPSTTIRYWERTFSEFWQPARTGGGQRRYGVRDVAFLRRLQDLSGSMPLASVRALLADEGREEATAGGGLDWTDKIILVTGGTGSFGRAFVRTLLQGHSPRTVRIYSRDELKQFQMQQDMSDPRLRFFIGDVRDLERLIKAARGADVIIHAAAMKQVPACEYNPFEAVKTNVMGATNVIDAALVNEVQRVIALSTDKAVNPVNLYGATKLCSDKLFVHANAYAGGLPTRFACVRYGNVLGSRGSVIPVFLKQRPAGRLTITDSRMTRFWITLTDAVNLVLRALPLMHGGEIFVPKIPSMKIVDVARAVAPECEQEIVGIRPGEKLHEVLINEAEGRHTVAVENFYIVRPNGAWRPRRNPVGGAPVGENFTYASDTNDWWLTVEELQKILTDKGMV